MATSPDSNSHSIDILPRLKAGDSYAGQLNEALRFGGFPLHGRPRCDRFAPVSVLRRLHGRLATPRVPRRRGCSVRRSNHGRAVCRIAGIPIRVCPTVSVRRGVRIGSRFGCWDTSGRCVWHELEPPGPRLRGAERGMAQKGRRDQRPMGQRRGGRIPAALIRAGQPRTQDRPDALRWPDLMSEKRRRAPFLNLLKSFYILLGPPQPYSPNGFRTVLSTKGERT